MSDITLEEELHARMLIYFAEQLGISSHDLSAILDGYVLISDAIARKLAHMFPDTSSEYWMRLAHAGAPARAIPPRSGS